MLAPDALERHQKKLYKVIEQEISLYNLKTKNEIASYQKVFEKNFSKQVQVSNKDKLIRAILKSSIILFGDFHPFRQSQKGFLRILQNIKNNKTIIALECFQQNAQEKIDQYLANLITLEELRDEVNFEYHWPFPWENYKEILIFAKENNLKVCGLNIKESKRTSSVLLERDLAAAKLIAKIAANQKKCKIFVLYGEMHLANSHLPQKLNQSISKANILIVHQNIPKLFWKSPILRTGGRPEVIKISKNEYCIFNAVPWVKLKSYLNWIEGAIEDEEEISDHSGEVHDYASILCKLLSLPKEPSNAIDILGPADLGSTQKNRFSAIDKNLFRHAVKFHRTIYLADSKILAVPLLTSNSLLEASAYLTWGSQSTKFGTPKTTNALIMYYFMGYLGSKLLNPKRKCNEIRDIVFFLKHSSASKKKNKIKRKIFSEALELLSAHLIELKKYKRTKPLNKPHNESVRIAGYILAERFFTVVSKRAGSLALARYFFTTSSGSEKWVNLNLRKISASIRGITAVGKHDKL